MKLKKLFAFLSAGVLCCCALGGTAFAEETEPVDLSQYQMGDITMDGIVDLDDAQLALKCYVHSLAGKELLIPYEQQLLGCIRGYVQTERVVDENDQVLFINQIIIDVTDAQEILDYYVATLAKSTELTLEEYVAQDEVEQNVIARFEQQAINYNEKKLFYSEDIYGNISYSISEYVKVR